jgi:hypothetical protein
LVNQGSLSLHPTNADEFRAHHGQSSAIQKLFGMSGRLLGTGTTAEYQLRPAAPPRLYQSHSCWPWILCGYHTGNPPQWNARQSIRDSLTNLTSSRTSSSETESSRFNSSIQSRPLLPGVVLPGHLQRSSQTRQSSAHSPPLYSQENVILGEYFGSSHYQTSGLETSARDASNLYAIGKETPSGTLDPLNQQLAAMAIEPSTSTSFSENSSGVGENQRHLEAVQAQLEESLQKYLRDHRPQQRDGQSQTINASQKRALAVILTTSLSAAEFRVPEHCSSIEQCEDFAMIASTIEGIVGDLALYGVALEPILVGGQLSIFVCSDDI